MTMDVSLLDPLTDRRWEDLVARHPRATVFHSRGWLDALKRTYGYEPFALTTTTRGPLENGLVVCRVRTWMSRRLVSLPFADHCDPLVDRPDALAAMVGYLTDELETRRWRALEMRPRRPVGGLAPAARYDLHTLDLSPPAQDIFKGFHRSSTQRAIRRAERDGLTYTAGVSERLLASFYDLLRLTRRRHGLPPQPLAWFHSLAACLPGVLKIHVASSGNQAIASILTLTFKQTMTYKYGGSDASRHRLGGMPFLFWRAVEEAKVLGLAELDLGRSDLDQPGLLAFKDHLGASRSPLTYYAWPPPHRAAHRGAVSDAARRIIGRLPDPALDLTGRLLYKHLG